MNGVWAVFDVLDNPRAGQLGRSPDEFLTRLQKPTLIRVEGRDRSRTRVLATLLHGNEPSGFFAVHRWLLLGEKPPTNMVFILGNIPAAKLAPCFSRRQLPGGRDMNRCFREPFVGFEGESARWMLDVLHEIRPEALIDMHNTSGTGPAFGVSICLDDRHLALTSLFTERLMYTELRLGALMEYSEREVPTVTVEVGGAQDEHAHHLAFEGLLRYIDREDVLVLPAADWALDVLRKPVRIELQGAVRLSYGYGPDDAADIVLRPDIEHFNFGVIQPDLRLGWVMRGGLSHFRVISAAGVDIRDKILRIDNGELFPARPLKAFMITTNPLIAKSDCLCYAVTDAGEQIL